MNVTTSFTLPLIIREDSDVESNQTFSLSLTSDDMGVSIVPDTAVITIIDASECAIYILNSHVGVCVVCVYDMVAGNGIPG